MLLDSGDCTSLYWPCMKGKYLFSRCTMTKRERIRAVVEGREPDKLPYSFWTHLPGIDLDPERLAEETYKFYRTYDVDFIKTMNNGMYAIEDFGCEIDYSEVLKGGVAHVVKTPIHQAEDWYKLSVCPVDKGSLARDKRIREINFDQFYPKHCKS